jgi:hypothetical protein
VLCILAHHAEISGMIEAAMLRCPRTNDSRVVSLMSAIRAVNPPGTNRTVSIAK